MQLDINREGLNERERKQEGDRVKPLNSILRELKSVERTDHILAFFSLLINRDVLCSAIEQTTNQPTKLSVVNFRQILTLFRTTKGPGSIWVNTALHQPVARWFHFG